MNLPAIQQGLVDLLSALAADDTSDPLSDGNVTWLGRQVPFISPDTQAGIYLRLFGLKGYCAPRKRNVWDPILRVIHRYRDEQKKGTLQIQVKSDEHTDSTCALVWLENIADNLRDPFARAALLALGLSIIRIHDIKTFEEVVDERSISVGTLDVELQIANSVQGSDALTIESFTGTGHVSGATTGTVDVPVSGSIP
jgi:hypothetical protein